MSEELAVQADDESQAPAQDTAQHLEAIEVRQQTGEVYHVRWRQDGQERAQNVRASSLRLKLGKLQIAAEDAQGDERDRVLTLIDTTQWLLDQVAAA